MESIAEYRRDEMWAPTEKKLARIAFDKAFERQCTAITQEARRMLVTATAPSKVFRVQEYLTEQRKIVDGLYDYRVFTAVRGFRQTASRWMVKGGRPSRPPTREDCPN